MKLKRQSKNTQIRWYQKELFDVLVENKALRGALSNAPGPDYSDRILYRTWYNGPRTDALEGQ